MVKVGFDALELTLMKPLALAVDSGANTALKVTLVPGLSVKEVFGQLLRLNPAPETVETVACEIVTLAPPVFVSESISVTLPPTWTFAKFRLLALAVS
jgi:hypothetical protein